MDKVNSTISSGISRATTVTLVVIYPIIRNVKSGATTVTLVVIQPVIGNAKLRATTFTIVIYQGIFTSKSGVITGEVFYVSWS
jgi:hypothetical protein